MQFQHSIEQTSGDNKEKYHFCLGIITCSNTKFSRITSEELYGTWWGELLVSEILGVEWFISQNLYMLVLRASHQSLLFNAEL